MYRAGHTRAISNLENSTGVAYSPGARIIFIRYKRIADPEIRIQQIGMKTRMWILPVKNLLKPVVEPYSDPAKKYLTDLIGSAYGSATHHQIKKLFDDLEDYDLC